MEYIIDPLLENLRFSVNRVIKDLLIIDNAMDKPTDYPAPYLSFGFTKSRTNMERGTMWRTHEVVMTYTFVPPNDEIYIDIQAAQRNLIKSHYCNSKIKTLNRIIFQMVKSNNPFAEKYQDGTYKGIKNIGTRFRFPRQFTINNEVNINRHGSDENQNWSVKARFDLMCVERAYYCPSQSKIPIPVAEEILIIIDDLENLVIDDDNVMVT
jgi:hypothetical protein